MLDCIAYGLASLGKNGDGPQEMRLYSECAHPDRVRKPVHKMTYEENLQYVLDRM